MCLPGWIILTYFLMPRCFTCVQKKTKPTPISAQLSPIMQPARNIKWRSSSKQCNSSLFPLFLPLFPVPRLRRRRRFETLIAHIQIPGRCATHTQRHIELGRAAADNQNSSFFIVAIAGSSVRRMSNAKRRRRVREWVPFFAAKINCGAHFASSII